MLKRLPLFLWVAMVIAALVFLYFVRGILFPFAASFLLAALLNPSVKSLERRSYTRPRAVLLIYTLFLLLILAPVLWLWNPIRQQADTLPQTISQSVNKTAGGVRQFLLNRPKLIDRYRKDVPDATVPSGKRQETRPEAIDRLVNTYVGQLSGRLNDLGPIFLSSVLVGGAGILSSLLNLVLIPIITFFLLIDLDKFKRQSILLIPESIRRPVVGVFEDIGAVFIRYIRGLITAATMYGILACIEFHLLGLPYSLVLGVLAGLLYFIPYVGPLTTLSLVAAVAAILPSPHTILFFIPFGSSISYTIAVTVIALCVYFLFDQTVTPRVVGGAVGLHPVFAFFAIMSGASLFGIYGMLLAYPIAGSIKVILNRLMPFVTDDEPPHIITPEEAALSAPASE